MEYPMCWPTSWLSWLLAAGCCLTGELYIPGRVLMSQASSRWSHLSQSPQASALLMPPTQLVC
eukprot:7482013-Pyramimonas_sp.AAC.1